MLAGAAIAGAILVSVPLLLMAANSDDDRKQNASSSSAADTVLGNEEERKPGEFVAESPSPTKSPVAEKTTKAPDSPKAPPPAPEKSPSPSASKKKAVVKADTGGMPSVVTSVLVKNWTNKTCADIPGFSKGANDGPVHQSACNSNTDDNQLWNLERKLPKAGPGGKDLFVIRNVMDGLCMDLPGSGPAGAATRVTEFPCNGTTDDNQLWWLDKKADNTYWIRNYASNQQCLDSQTADNQNRDLIVYPCAAEKFNNHQWFFPRK